MRDLYNNIEARVAEVPIATAQTNNDPIVTETVDMRGFKSMVWLVILGVLADVAFTTVVLIEESDNSNMSSSNEVVDAQLDPTELVMAFDTDDDSSVRKIGYVGEKRYVRMTITPSYNTGNLPIAIITLMGDPDRLPTTAQAT